MHPGWLGSPQHLAAGLLLGAAVTAGARRLRLLAGVAFIVGVGIVATAEIVVELVEYPLLYSGEPHVTADYDIAATQP